MTCSVLFKDWVQDSPLQLDNPDSNRGRVTNRDFDALAGLLGKVELSLLWVEPVIQQTV